MILNFEINIQMKFCYNITVQSLMTIYLMLMALDLYVNESIGLIVD